MDVFFVFSTLAMLINIGLICINLLLGGNAPRGKSCKLFDITKLLLIPSISIVWLQITHDVNWKVIVFGIFCWLGDLFLLFPKLKYTIIGGLCFAIGHLSINLFFDIHWKSVSKLILSLIIPIPLINVLYFVSKSSLTNMLNLAFLSYYLLLNFNLASSAARCYIYPIFHPSFILCFVGYCFFVVSDSFLLLHAMGVDKNPRRFGIMSTYSVAQVLIHLGAALAI